MMSPAFAWKLVLAVALAGAIFASACAHAPQRSFPRSDLRRLVLCALGLYAIGLLASLSHHGMLAAVLYAAGIAVSALAAWLSRGVDAGGPPSPDAADGETPPPAPEDAPGFDWERFEREFRVYDRRRRPQRTPV